MMLSSDVGRSMSTMDEETRARMRHKFDVCYVMAKHSIPFAQYPALLELEKQHGVDIGHAYNTPASAKSFSRFISMFHESRFFSLLMDGTTDAGNVEDELLVIRFRSKAQEVVSCTQYLSVHSPEKADTNGLLLCIKDALKPFRIEDVLKKDSILDVEGKPALVGIATEGASVNIDRSLKDNCSKLCPGCFGAGATLTDWN